MDGERESTKIRCGFWPTFIAAVVALNRACDDAFGPHRDTAGSCAVTSCLTMKTTTIAISLTIAFMKPRVMLLAVFTAVVGMAIAHGHR
jgi:hypothetical protein